MERFLSILLLLLLGLPSAVPVLGSAAVRDGSWPACCRRAGAHHCAMSAMERVQLVSGERQWRAVPEPCPFGTQLRVHPSPGPVFSATAHRASVLPAPGQAGIVAQAGAALRIARVRVREKRGPPFPSQLESMPVQS